MRAEALRALFAKTWIEDELRLAQAMQSADARRVLQTLHRVKGALLTLGERKAADCCDALRDAIETEGIAAATAAICRFRERVGAIAADPVGVDPMERPPDA